MADIKKLLRKRSWTGKEVGLIYLTNRIVLNIQSLKGEKKQPIVTDDKFIKMFQSLNDREQLITYNKYASIASWVSSQYNIAQIYFMQVQLQYRTMESYINRAILAEDVYKYIEHLPAIMTQKQYDESKTARLEKWLVSEEGTENFLSLFDIVGLAIAFYFDALIEQPEMDNPLIGIKEKYINEPIKSEYIIKNWSLTENVDYYILEDGRRSDQMTNEEWQAAIMTPKTKEALNIMSKPDKISRQKAEDIENNVLLETAKVIYASKGRKGNSKALSEASYNLGYAVPGKAHYMSEPPKNFSKWDFFEKGYMPYFYKSASIEVIKDFCAEFEELANIIIKEIDKVFCNKEKPVSLIPIEEWDNPLISARHLYDNDYFSFKAVVDSEVEAFEDNIRAYENGISIIKTSPFRGQSVDSKGYFKEPDIQNSLYPNSLEAFFKDSKYSKGNILTMEDSRVSLLDSYFYLAGYNYALDRIAAIHDVPELSGLKIDIEGVNDRLDVFNNLVPVLYKSILDTNYSNEELKAKKLEVLENYFQPINYKVLYASEENKKKADTLIKDFSPFEHTDSGLFLKLLFYRPTEETKEGE